jgi:AraC-like DNA-binding protein
MQALPRILEAGFSRQRQDLRGESNMATPVDATTVGLCGSTVAQLAKRTGLSRSAFFERFTRTLGIRPMEYLLVWRMAVARDLLRHDFGIAEVGERVGHGSASIFSTAFSRHVGMPPGRYARAG